jgi:hypothetical protein
MMFGGSTRAACERIPRGEKIFQQPRRITQIFSSLTGSILEVILRDVSE